MNSIDQLKELVQKNPDVLKYLQQPEVKKETKKPKIVPGQTIEIPHDESTAPIAISMAQAKKLLKKQRKPRELSEESKAKMLANLQKGRESLKLKKEQKLQAVKQALAQPAQTKPVAPKQVAAKFIVKPPAPKKAKAVVVEDVLSDDDSIETQLERNEALLRQIQQMQEKAKTKIPGPPALKRQKRFSLFY
jgi:hypothetical protein